MGNKDIKVIIETLLKNEQFKKGIRQTQDNFQKTEKQSNKFFSSMKKGFALLGGALGVGMLIKGLKNVININKEFEQSVETFCS